MITELFKTVNENKGSVVSLDICSVVKGKALSNFKTYTIIKNALFPDLEGHYEMDNGLWGHSHYENLSEKGLLINFKGSQIFIPERSKISTHKNDPYMVFDIKDKYSSMYIK